GSPWTNRYAFGAPASHTRVSFTGTLDGGVEVRWPPERRAAIGEGRGTSDQRPATGDGRRRRRLDAEEAPKRQPGPGSAEQQPDEHERERVERERDRVHIGAA